ncbi:phage tail assembly chaperone G [Peribacillus muralis]|uniref:phage tail assembly chaperone G n=1 Tax=Peribacillus muralis TaxID=264697 RepID=UPI003D0107C5
MYTLDLTDSKTKEVTTLTQTSVNGKHLITALKIHTAVYEDEVESTMALINFVADLFDVKANDILEGIQAHELMDKMYEVYYKVLGYSEKKSQKLIQFMKDGEMEPELD